MFVIALLARVSLGDAEGARRAADEVADALLGVCRFVDLAIRLPFMCLNLLIWGKRSPHYPQYENITRTYSNFVNRPAGYTESTNFGPRPNVTPASAPRPQPAGPPPVTDAPPDPGNGEPGARDLAAKSADIGAKSDDIAAKSDDIGAKSDDIAAKSDDIGAKSDDLAAKSDDIAAKSGDIGAKSDRLAPETGSGAVGPPDEAPETAPFLPPEILRGSADSRGAEGEESLGNDKAEGGESSGHDRSGGDGKAESGFSEFANAVDELERNVTQIAADVDAIVDDYTSGRATRDYEEKRQGLARLRGDEGEVADRKQRLQYSNVPEMQSPFFLTEIAGDEAGKRTMLTDFAHRFLSSLPKRLGYRNIAIPEGGLTYPGIRANITYRSPKAVPISRVVFSPIDNRDWNIKTFVIAFGDDRTGQYGVSTGILTLRRDLSRQQQIFNLPTMVEASSVRIIVLENYGSEDETCFCGVRIVHA
jgi:hypothetical protein